MITDLVEIQTETPDPGAIRRAAAVIREGGIVAIPTDSLYMIVADPFNLNAVGKVFAAKGRESSRSLPLLVNDVMMVENLASEVTVRFQILARRFWPGPLTIIVPASAKVPLKLTGNTGRLALRHTKSAVGSALIEFLGMPLIATSANMSGVPTCRSGIEVFGTMDGRVDLVVDGGHCVGEGATTIDITEPYWRIIKEGAVLEREIAEVLKGN
ncbi:L-threonylcarbamoyladenylate synthase [Bryobacter aggregatus]|uniref:L-threonylcarbamoyladenylate synthase n=1 Tax=Bryobacter aggregatus TaxID=360054 RepID=UPI0004E10289|nr:L-threonylcarbamoyladenylate synthase [Bryobacter aggregatus]